MYFLVGIDSWRNKHVDGIFIEKNRKNDIVNIEMDTFNELGITEPLCEKLKERGITKPTAIQNIVIPKLLTGESIIFRSQTGTGKTFAYLLPVLQLLGSDYTQKKDLQALIIAPTLELAAQIKMEIDFLLNCFPSPLKSALLSGSAKLEKQIETLKKTKPIIAAGNAGRLLSLLQMGKLKVNNLRFLILDEADRLTTQDSMEETGELLNFIRKRTQKNILVIAGCSATVNEKTKTLLGPMFENIQIAESDDHEILRKYIEHWAIFSERRRRVQTLRSLYAALKTKKSRIKMLVFTSRNDEAGNILSQLQHHHISAAGLFAKEGGKPISPQARKESLEAFRSGKVEILVSTDLAARGLDIQGISHVVALDVPSESDIYIHRCGRTGRAGKKGIMVTIGDEVQMHLLSSMEKKLRIRIQPKELYGGKICVPQMDTDT